MTVSVVLMIIIGIILIIVSFFITEKLTKKEENFNIDLLTIDDNYEFSERELRIIKRKIEDVIAKQAKDILYETNESLSNMANEKTMALGDYAVAVCDEIEKNHKEVMFLYSMLDDKQKEIMNTVKAVDETKHDVQEIISETKKQMTFLNNENNEGRKNASAIEQLTALSNKRKNEEKAEESVSDVTEKQEKMADKTEFEFTESDISEKEAFRKEEKTEVASKKEYLEEEVDLNTDLDDVFAEIDKEEIDFDEVLDEEFKENANSNDIILEMHRNGSTIIDIAKQLGLGVGEVKLVIDLYQGE